jgi:hypothetical protein
MFPDTELERRVQKFVAENAGTTVNRLEFSTTLRGDIGLEGDDAFEMMTAFAQQFNVDMRTYVHDKHFGPEGCGCFPLTLVLYWLRSEALPRTPWLGEEVPITVGNLVEAARAGKWVM